LLELAGAARRQVIASALKADVDAHPQWWDDAPAVDWNALPDMKDSVGEVAWGAFSLLEQLTERHRSSIGARKPASCGFCRNEP
jgi:hypothetical protein